MSIYPNNIKLYTKGITKYYQGMAIIDDISVCLKENEIVSVLGPSGVGKTTLFHIISGLLKPDIGGVFYNNEEVTGKIGYISYMQQKDLLLPFKKVIDNISLPLILKGENKQTARSRAKELMEEFGLSDCEELYPEQLSGGMRQRAALIRTYLQNNDVALFDEPFSALDALTKASMQDWFTAFIKNMKMQAFFITHDIDEAISLSDRIYIINGIPGKITTEITIDKQSMPNSEFKLTQTFLEYKKQIIGALEIKP